MRILFFMLLSLLISSCASNTYTMHSHDEHHPHYFEHKHIEGSDPDMNWEKHEESVIYDDCDEYYQGSYINPYWRNCDWN